MTPNRQILLIGMPWESAARPSLAIGTLVELARNAGFDCSVQHLNLVLSAKLGPAYDAFAENVALFPLAEHFFAADLFGTTPLDSEDYLARFGGGAAAEGEAADPLHELRDRDIPAFLEEAARTIALSKPDIVGFTCTFNQVLASLALARRLKILLPEVTILFGGACVHGKMGQAYAKMFPQWIDYVFTGEADDSFPEWLEAYGAGEPDRPIRGIASRHGFQAGRPTANLDRLPMPTFDEFFDQRSKLEATGVVMRHVRHLPYESSRGCWWGESHHCTFCGLNNEGMLFRRKSSQRVVAELECLVERYGVTSFMASDNILDFKAYTGLLGDLAATEIDLDLFYEIKANVTRANVAALRDAGVRRVQPGIESFSDHVLKIMRKGITALQNVQALKWLQEYGIDVDYNMLIGFPGETREDYISAIAIMRAIPHLPPPNGTAIPVRVDRFSPFFEDSDALGIRNVRAAESYRHLIPPELGAAENYAYFFDHDQSELDAFAAEIDAMNDVMTRWKSRQVERRARLGKGCVELLEAADSGRTRYIMRDIEALIFVLSDRVTSLSQLTEKLTAIADPATIRAAVVRMAEASAVYVSDDYLVATVAYAVPHTQVRLSRWLAQNGLPDHENAGSPTLQCAMPPASGHGPGEKPSARGRADRTAVG